MRAPSSRTVTPKQPLLAVLAALAAASLLSLAGCERDPSGVGGDWGVGGDASNVKCGPGLVGCSGVCTDTSKDTNNCGACGTQCKDGELCSAGKCTATCPSGQTACSGTCVDTQADPDNCGACGTQCKAGEVCSGGKCAANCGSPLTECSGKCVNTQKDNQNCGACANACKAGEACVAGTCTVNCPAGFTNCSGVCAKLASDQDNCGACGTQCQTGEICQSGKCTYVCPPGLADCSGQCVNTQADDANCGACGTTCKAGHVCSGGKCLLNCPPNHSDCSGVCKNLNADLTNCGVCGTKCGKDQICLAGKCVINCPPNHSDCSGVCKNLNADPVNCGACGVTCGKGQVCSKGKCALTCLSGHTDCSGSCADLQTDPANCGTCGNACQAGTTCKYGKCVPIWCDVFTYGLSARPVDITFIIDQSGSMSQEIASVKSSLNTFSTFITNTNIDYHVIMLASRGTSTYAICIPPPLGGANCGDGSRYRQVNVNVQSRDSLTKFQANITAIEAFHRQGSLRHIVEITDDYSSLSSSAFNSWITARTGWKDYVFNSIVATQTGGYISHICSANWTNLFNQLAKSVTGVAIKQYKPTKAPVVSSIELYFNNQFKVQGTDWKWDTSNNLIELMGTAPAIGTKIMACYLLQ